jgi:hypothetical protein
MRRTAVALVLPAAGALIAATALSAAAHGNHGPAGDSSAGDPASYSIELRELNGSGSSGVAVLTFAEDGSLTVNVEAEGMVPGQPHAQHVHGDRSLERDFTCPTQDADVDGDGVAAGPSELDPALPQEATAPASCGIIEGSNISAIPAGGVDTGVAPLTGTGNGAVAGPQVLAFSAIVGIGALWVIGMGLRRQRTALR